MNNDFSVAAHWNGDFNETGLQQWAENLRAQLKSTRVDLGLVFLTPKFFSKAQTILEIIRVHAQVSLLAGCSSQALIAGAEEIEENAGISLALYSLPGAELKAYHFAQEQVEEANGPGYWRLETGVEPEQTNGWLAFIDPFHLDSESWLRGWNEAYAPLPVMGGLASGDFSEQRTQVYLNGDVFEEGGVAISIGGEIKLASVISQGCTPIGETWTLTRVEENVIHEIGNRPAYEVLEETFSKLSPAEQKVASGNLFIGLVVNEYLENFHRGDFLIRNLLAADAKSGCIAVGAYPRLGQTVQFQRRSAAAAMEDMSELLAQARQKLSNQQILGACLCSCNGRGEQLFGRPNHDAKSVQDQFGPIGLAGFFCNGEIGPVGEKSFLHGFTASLALFVRNR
ncbi:MAG TPA: FIST N-terminal domain-containing protein [Verrucomicrobiae bacterium]|nr:FIST N-terminal domain-containing protein [Verrucomicrobiae bacterium]